MTIARRLLLDPTGRRFYHITSRCVRRAFLCGEGYEHRKEWIYIRLRLLVSIFPVAVAGYAVMANHLHLIVRYDPTAAANWSAAEVHDRWQALRPTLAGDGAAALRARLIADAAWVERTRAKLGSLGWFMRELKYHIARKANQEDGCTGHFWEGRFRSVPLLNQAALAACMVYVDLNPLRAGVVRTPEESSFVGIQERLQALRGKTTHPLPAVLRRRRHRSSDAAHLLASDVTCDVDERHPAWMLPLRACVVADRPLDTRAAAPPWTDVAGYLQLVDQTGRLLRADKRGAIAPELAGILARLDLEPERWRACMSAGGQMYGTGLGHWVQRQTEALRRGARWLANRSCLFVGRGTGHDAHRRPMQATC